MPYYEEPTPELIEQHEEFGYYPKPDDFEPNPDFPIDHPHYGQPRCQAWNAYHGRQCKANAMVSRGLNAEGKLFDKCRTHGGKSLRGSALHSFKHGRYSAFLPTRLAAKYEDMESDVDLLDMRSRAELLEIRVLELVENLDEKGSFDIFMNLQEQWEIYEKYMQLARGAGRERQKEYSTRAADALNHIGGMIKEGADQGNIWNEIRTNIEAIRKLADTEQRQMKTAENTVMVDRVMTFAAAMASIFRDSIMSIEALALDRRKNIIANVETQVSSLLTLEEQSNILDIE